MLQAAQSRETRDRAREVKFLVPPDVATQILHWARPQLGPDPYAGGDSGDEYLTTTIYFDTQDFKVYRRIGSYRRSKYRIRRYGQAPVTFLERKLRTATLLSKRRTTIPVEDLSILSSPPVPTTWGGSWFAERLAARKLSPVAQVSYHRHARVGATPFGPMRLTFDTDIRAQASHGLSFDPPNGLEVLSTGTIIEMKYCVTMPPVLKELVHTFKLTPAAVSKYRLSMESLRAAGIRTGADRVDLSHALAVAVPVSGRLHA